MKKTLAVLALSLSFASVSLAAETSIALTIKTHETLILRKVTKTSFSKISQNAVGSAKVNFISGSQVKELYSQEINETDNTSALTLEATGKNVLKVVDEKEQINQEVKAEIKKSLLGSIKTIKIDSATMQGLYAKSMKKSGLDVLKNLRIFGKGSALRSSLTTTDLNCSAEGDLLVCNQDATLLIEVGN